MAVGVLVIAVLFTALIGPYFIDWTSYRETFEREASAYVGRPVTVAGKAGVRLLPTPVLSFTDIHVGDPARPDVEMERFRAEVELAPLLKGEVRIIQMAVERPRFRIDIGGLAENRGVFGSEWRLDPDRISLERLQIVEGTAVIDDSANGRSWQADDINAVIEATTLLGPGKIEANLALDGEPLAVRANFGRVTDLSSVTMNLLVSSPNLPVTLSTDGTLHFSAETPPSYEGLATIEGVQPESEDAPRSRWADFRASGAFSMEPADLTIEEMQISYGAMERPLVIEASGQVAFGNRPRFDISLGARQIDLDRTLGGGEGTPFAIETALASLVELLPRAAPPPLPGSLRLEAQGVVVGGSVIQAVGIDLVTAGNSWVVEDFAAMLPGETRIDLNGTLGLSAGATFRGHARMASKRPAALATWWRGAAGSAGRIGGFSVEADIDITPDRQQLSNFAATTGEGTIEGSVDVRRFQQHDQLFVNVALSAERADLVETRALAELLVGKTVQAGQVDQMTLSLSADVLSAGGVEARSVRVEGGLENGEINFRRLSVADLAGASIDAHGSIQDPFGTPYGRVDASIKADDIGGAAKFLLSVLPESRAVQRLQEVAPILSPVTANVLAEAGAAGERVLLELEGSFADTRITLEAEGAGSLAKPETLAGTLSLHAVAEDSAKVLRQLGFDLLPVRSLPLSVSASFDGAVAAAGKLKVEGTAAGVDFTYDAETALNEGRIATAGELKAESVDVDQALLLAGIAAPGIGGGHSASAAGRLEYSGEKVSLALSEASFVGQPVTGMLAADFADGVSLSGALDLPDASLPALAALTIGARLDDEGGGWSDGPFAEALPENVSLNMSLNAARLDIGALIEATDARLGLKLDDGKLQIDLAGSGFAGGALKGSLSAAVVQGQSELSIQAALEDGTLQSLVWERVGLPVASGTLDVSFEASGHGRSVAGILATLSGSGSFSIDGGRLNALNPDALAAVMAAAEGDTEPDDNQARETFASLFGSGALAFGQAEGSFAIANGAVSIPTVSLAADKTKVLAEATVDLNAMTLKSGWKVSIEEGEGEEAQPTVEMAFNGPMVRPARDIDLVPLLDLLRSRFLQIKLEELEELQRQRDEAEKRAADDAARQAAAEAELTTGATGGGPQSGLPLEPVPEAAEPAPETATPELPLEPPPSAETSAAEPAPAQPEPLAEPAPPAQAVGRPAAQAPAAAPPVEPAPQQTRRPTPSAAPVAPAGPVAPAAPLDPALELGPLYKTLPNGVVVKIR
ncbi:MAG: AsmA family protein [Propylenella sp.]